jgi:hexosaminidase
MKLILNLFLAAAFSSTALSAEIFIVPRPAKVQIGIGQFMLSAKTKIFVASSDSNLQQIASGLQSKLSRVTVFPMPITHKRKSPTVDRIVLKLMPERNDLGPEGYTLSVTPNTVTVSAPHPAGVFYGIQSLYQLLPPQVDGSKLADSVSWNVPCVEIEDQPRFQWRGMHLDVCRHFFPVEFVKKYIDLLAAYKMNTFHWHLTDDQGWRIEIKKYPKLTTIGAWRKQTMGDSTRYGGYYTQKEIRDVVAYAKKRYITIVPEIEMPGHSLAALASYPELACTRGPFQVGTEWGVFDDVYCAGNEKTFRFLENVLKEVMALFPSKVIHIGGDEVPKTRWKACRKCQQRIKREELKDEDELQSYFIQRIEKFLNRHGRHIIGWDEILEGGLAPNALVMSWRGEDGGIAAAQVGHDAVMTPGSYCYFDHYQGKYNEPVAIGGFTPIEKLYMYEPVPAALSPDEAKHILGAQGNLWTEYILDSRQAEYMLMPRMLALSEVLWSPKELRDSTDFFRRLDRQYERLVDRDVNFRVPPPNGVGGNKFVFGETSVNLSSPISGGVIRYTLDSTEPTSASLVFAEPIFVSKACTLSARTFWKDRMSPWVTSVYHRLDSTINGVAYLYYEGEWDSIPVLAALEPVKSGTCYDLSLDGVPRRSENYAVQLTSHIKIDSSGDYRFSLESDDGSKLFIDDSLVVNNDGLHGRQSIDGAIHLAAAVHTLVVQQFQRTGSECLDVWMEAPGMPKQRVPPEMLLLK